MSFKRVNPKSLGRPSGYTNGLLTTPDTRLLFIAGQIGWDESQQLVSEDFVEQFDRALQNVLAVVHEVGGVPGSVARMVIYVTSKEEYRLRRREIGERWRAQMGKHYPAMVLVEVKSLLEDGAKVEIEGIAVI
ncbi:MAG TPA: RidA family protein [Pyrinomonadaceae bacterium]|jgi:enamine deaminase RidA (YjgF/YER057c/UK114 family)